MKQVHDSYSSVLYPLLSVSSYFSILNDLFLLDLAHYVLRLWIDSGAELQARFLTCKVAFPKRTKILIKDLSQVHESQFKPVARFFALLNIIYSNSI